MTQAFFLPISRADWRWPTIIRRFGDSAIWLFPIGGVALTILQRRHEGLYLQAP